MARVKLDLPTTVLVRELRSHMVEGDCDRQFASLQDPHACRHATEVKNNSRKIVFAKLRSKVVAVLGET